MRVVGGAVVHTLFCNTESASLQAERVIRIARIVFAQSGQTIPWTDGGGYAAKSAASSRCPAN